MRGPILASAFAALAVAQCDNVDQGYQCQTNISHNWGQYTPYFSVPSNISSDVPEECTISFVQILSRHGARDPTAAKTAAYAALINKIHTNASSYGSGYEFIQNYSYTLGADQLTTFGQQQMVNSGIKFYNRYQSLASAFEPFIRSSSEARVVESAQNFSQGYESASQNSDPAYPYPILVLSEDAGFNNTLNHDLCTNFENGTDSSIASAAQKKWASVFVPSIQSRVNSNLPGANLSTTEIVYLMDLCPFNTVASDNGTVSSFCSLFTDAEWANYGYYESLNKFYGFSLGNPLGPTQGAGFAAELIARLTGNRSYVTDAASYTSINHTLDNNQDTFPLGGNSPLFADFSHDNDMTGIFSALGLYNQTALLSNTTRQDETATNGYSAAWTVPFAARAYFEKMVCSGQPEELVRVLVNDRVIPLQNCGADDLGRCSLSAFVESQIFVTDGGLWNQCFS